MFPRKLLQSEFRNKCRPRYAWNQGESVFRLRKVNIVGFYYLFNCATCFGHTAIFMHTYFPRTSSIDNAHATGCKHPRLRSLKCSLHEGNNRQNVSSWTCPVKAIQNNAGHMSRVRNYVNKGTPERKFVLLTVFETPIEPVSVQNIFRAFLCFLVQNIALPFTLQRN
jgi:hypothetical protein